MSGSTLVQDQFAWDINNEQADPEAFAKTMCQELALEAAFVPLIAWQIRAQVLAVQKLCISRFLHAAATNACCRSIGLCTHQVKAILCHRLSLCRLIASSNLYVGASGRQASSQLIQASEILTAQVCNYSAHQQQSPEAALGAFFATQADLYTNLQECYNHPSSASMQTCSSSSTSSVL